MWRKKANPAELKPECDCIMSCMHIEIDQSGKFERTDIDTVISYSNGKTYSVLIPARIKRTCVLKLRNSGIVGNRLYIQLFAAVIFLLIRDQLTKVSRVIIDAEYTGREGQIKDNLINIIHRAGLSIDAYVIQFGHVGKKAKVHHLALSIWRKKKKADKILSTDDIMKVLKTLKKSGPPYR